MSPTNIVKQPVLRCLVVALMAACGGSESGNPDAAPDALARCMENPAAPTFTQLYASYFAVGTPGHCATEDCHGQNSFNSWSCGDSKDRCYNGMVAYGLINTSNPLASRLVDPSISPLRWFNANGGMPQDDIRPFNQGRDAIAAWVAGCAPNN